MFWVSRTRYSAHMHIGEQCWSSNVCSWARTPAFSATKIKCVVLKTLYVLSYHQWFKLYLPCKGFSKCWRRKIDEIIWRSWWIQSEFQWSRSWTRSPVNRQFIAIRIYWSNVWYYIYLGPIWMTWKTFCHIYSLVCSMC